MKISIACADVSNNAFGRAYILAKMLGDDFETEIVGPAMGDGVWSPMREGLDVACRFVRMGGGADSVARLGEIMALMDGDVLYASKPLFHSYVLALRARGGRRVVLDVDDWDWGYARERLASKPVVTRIYDASKSIFSMHRKNGPAGAWLGDCLAPRADAVTVSNRFLQDRFGGVLIPHGRDENAFDPARFDAAALRRAEEIQPDQKVVMFLGTPRAHKGIVDLIDAMCSVDDASSLLLVAGLDRSEPSGLEIARYAEATLGDRFRSVGPRPFALAPETLALADVVAIPQRSSPASVGQMPAKLYDALAMGKPIVSTAVSDIHEVVGGCGWIARPGDAQDLARQLSAALADETEAHRRGALARKRFVERYSWSAIHPTLAGVFGERPDCEPERASG